MEYRTRQQERLFNQALGYAWGQYDIRRTYGLSMAGIDSLLFAQWYAVATTERGHQTVQDAYYAWADMTPADRESALAGTARLAYVGEG